MKRWRELGEVPDSDDDSFDDTESHIDDDLDELPPNDDHEKQAEEPTEEGTQTEPAKDGDIWDIPSSLPGHVTPSPLRNPVSAHASQILSQPPWSARPTPQNKDATTISTPAEKDAKETTPTPPSTRLRTTDNSFPEDEISTGYVRATTPTPLSRASSPASLLSRTPTPPRSLSLPRARPSPPQNRGASPDEDAAEELSRQTAVRLERSLRPRKPIQQHPYLYENAQYTTFMKSHGVKPIRVIQESQAARTRPEEEDFQDQEFQAEESQETSGNGHAGLGDSGPIFFDDDEDELALTPSLPKTSPRGQQLRASSQQTAADQTDNTSLSDEEFPPLERLPVSARKRQTPQVVSSTTRKRRRFVPSSSPQGSPQRPKPNPPRPLDIWNLSSSPSGPRLSEKPLRTLETTPQLLGKGQPTPLNASGWKPTSTPAVADSGVVGSPILIDKDTESDHSEGSSTGSADSSGSDSEVVRKHSRRIHGVLPASWLRLDQQGKPAAPKARRRSPEPSPERTVRRGVALPRHGFSKPSNTVPLPLFDESEDSGNEPPRRLAVSDEPVQIPPAAVVIVEDDGASVVEEDTIDRMLPGRKRSGSYSTPTRAKKQKRIGTQSVFRGRPDAPTRQPRITQAFGPSKQGVTSASAKGDSTSQVRRQKGGSSAKHRSKKRASTPPLLSVLDVVEPDAPKFVKIAARAVKKRANLGKTSPTKKLISLATRSDNVDALSVLRDWKSGKTKPKIPVPQARRQEKPRNRPALREISTNPAPRPRGAQPQKLVRQTSLDSFVRADDEENLHGPQPPAISLQPRKPLQDRQPSFHPAQLEEDVGKDKRRQLNARKRTMDALYRRNRRIHDTLTDDGLDQVLDVDFTLREPAIQEQDDSVDIEIETEEPPVPANEKRDVRSRFRKKRRPQQIDLEAPQYARVNDPLPASFSDFEIQEHPAQDKVPGQDKLKGLGPYGTHYTHHFEVFPLDRGVFFHESTVIGRGLVQDALDPGLADRIRHPRPAVSFTFDGRTLRWAAWDDNTSSDFGILVDWVVDQLVSNTTTDDGTGRKTVEAADFILGYILRSLSVPSDLEEKAFVPRCLEVFSSFASRLESTDWSAVPDGARRTQLDVAVRISLAIQAVRSIGQSSSSDAMQSMKLDDLLKKSASLTVRRLLECGTEELQTLYGDLQRSAFRERGIRADRYLANCWVVMMRLLESAAIPRGSFWDVTQSAVLSGVATPSSDTQAFERLWQDMFTLLPLSEIDNCGLLVAGMRHTAPVEGWTLPQQLLKRVFQLYQANPRQPPGFNDYCRALVARCHFLVQQWGWRKCTGIIGTIFDFFGSQNLAHLRNEEVYKSPKFLEELDGKPSLSIEPEDRCFHIFTKLLALTIQRLKELGRVKDIRNLMTRTLPNHNRQYLKEDTIHQHDLAALRNHHDLLCTLFWVSPPDLRPAVHLIEKLVVPGSAHKQACLINVRAWNQLARFVIASGEGQDAFRPLAVWRNNVFNQVLDQYLSAASDIEQQFRELVSKMVGISKEMRDNMVAKNKATALDVLHLSVKASLDVLRRAPTLEVALYGLNTGQLQKVFTSLDYQSPGFDWSILRVALETLEHLMGRIDQASEEQYSSGFDDNVDAPHLEDAVLLVNEHLVKDFFWMSRTTLALPLDQSSRQYSLQAACAEKTVTLAARIAARFIKNRVTSLLPYFSSGKHCLFPDVPRNLNTPERRYLPLFLAVLVKNHVFDFKDLGINILGLWMLSIVKPSRLLGYENYLAEVLKQHSLPFLERATVPIGSPPDYNSNIDFFACAIHHMRKTLRESAAPHQRRQHRDEFSQTLQLVMHKMRDDLALLRPPNTTSGEHALYIAFVQQIISLIKSHGVDICAVDPFFTQPSADYSPPLQDPQLHMAGIVAYGVKLGEREFTAAPQFFHYLYNSFKTALGNDRLEQERSILGRAMRKERHVVSFVLQFMLPAVVRAVALVPACWALLEVYTLAFGDLLDGACVSRELGGDDMEHAAGVLGGILAWFEGLRSSGGATVDLQQLHVATLLATTANALQPSLASYMFNEPDYDSAIPSLRNVVDGIAALFLDMRSHLEDVLSLADEDLSNTDMSLSTLLSGLAPTSSPSPTVTSGTKNPRVQEFAKVIAADVRKDWVVTADRVMVRMPGGRGAPVMSQSVVGSSAASLQGTRYVPWEEGAVLKRLLGEVGRWELGGGSSVGRERGRKGRGGRGMGVSGEELLF